MTTKYDIGKKVYTVLNGELDSGKIGTIRINEDKEVIYTILRTATYCEVDEEYIFTSKKEAKQQALLQLEEIYTQQRKDIINEK